ncbi:Uronate isomerase [Limihaloglobus sulfuriphilus]|uniref:Uronate isomerase n=1 Tax=Limihaloglobus sulfuriphilus TaxID=1851148 RepID=A0A1Q2MHV9_9BACT|nr:glucuronate isomerase [Limihaloglobus sulfuriphilus]AQQ72295.1 Uronate isomerase [Limihaloglobus sulfuriphilus]
MSFITKDFLLNSEPARKLYHEYAADMPIYDYHCHISPADIADDRRFQNISEVWLHGDHYKWRAMRSNGVEEKFCTGNASDWEKFQAWAATVPCTLRNPLYHWTHLELKNTFGIDKLLNPDTAREIYDKCSEMLRSSEFSCRSLIRRANVRVICTTDDPVDGLGSHKRIKESGFEAKVLPTWRPDRGMDVDHPARFNAWVDRLESAADMDIRNYANYIAAIRRRHNFFHDAGCRMSDHGLETVFAEEYSEADAKRIFDLLRCGENVSGEDVLKFKSAMLHEFALMDAEKGWVQQFHIGAMRNNNTRFANSLGPDTGFDSIGDCSYAKPLSRFLDRLDQKKKLAKTILYNLHPKDNEMLATMIGNFQDGTTAGKMQYGSGWWFLDQKDGMTKQIEALSNLGLLSRFVGMLTDSRSFLSYSRHEYFRRILCSILGSDIKNGEIPEDYSLVGKMVQDICYNNAVNYFGIEV